MANVSHFARSRNAQNHRHRGLASRQRGLDLLPAPYVEPEPPAERTMRLPLFVFVSLLAGCAHVPDPFPPGPAAQARAYEGPLRPEEQVATVFITDGRPHYESGFICKVNGRNVLADGGCASVLYLAAGSYTIGVRYRSQTQVGHGEMPLRVEPGKLYQLNTTSFRIGNAGMVSLIRMPPGSKVTYRNVAPNMFPASMLDQVIPYPAQ